MSAVVISKGSTIPGSPALNDAALGNLLGGAAGIGYTPSVSLNYTAGSTNTLVVTDNTTYGSYNGNADGLLCANVEVTDDTGYVMGSAQILTTGGGGAITISTAALDTSLSGFVVSVNITTTQGLHFDGNSQPITLAGTYNITNAFKVQLG